MAATRPSRTTIITDEIRQKVALQREEEKQRLIARTASMHPPENRVDVERSARRWLDHRNRNTQEEQRTSKWHRMLGDCPICGGEGPLGNLCYNGGCDECKVEFGFTQDIGGYKRPDYQPQPQNPHTIEEEIGWPLCTRRLWDDNDRPRVQRE